MSTSSSRRPRRKFTDEFKAEGAPTAEERAEIRELKRELANRRRWATRADVRRDLIRCIEGWFNARRLHSSIDYRSPVEHETLYHRRGDGIAAQPTCPPHRVNLRACD